MVSVICNQKVKEFFSLDDLLIPDVMYLLVMYHCPGAQFDHFDEGQVG